MTKQITIIQENASPLIVEDKSDDNITEYTNELCKLLESNNISIVHTTTCSVIIRPNKITSVIVRDITPNSTDITTEKIDDEVPAPEDPEAGIISD